MRSFLFTLLTILILNSCSKTTPVPTRVRPTFSYTLDGTTYTTEGFANDGGVGLNDGITLRSVAVPILVGGIKYYDRIDIVFNKNGSGKYIFSLLQLYRTSESNQTQILNYQTDVDATVVQGATISQGVVQSKTWSGTFTGNSTNTQNQVVSSLTKGTFANLVTQ